MEQTADYLMITPDAGLAKTAGILFYPGALVDPAAYVPVFSDLAAQGYQVCIVRFPSNLGVLDPAKGVRLAQSLGGTWVIGGHSLGGVMAANAVKANPTVFKALYFFASWPASGDDLSSWTGNVLSLSGELDGLSTPAEIDANKVLLPSGASISSTGDAYPSTSPYTVYHQIPGGNHGQFGNYGAQSGDNTAAITPEAQWAEIQAYLGDFLSRQVW